MTETPHTQDYNADGVRGIHPLSIKIFQHFLFRKPTLAEIDTITSHDLSTTLEKAILYVTSLPEYLDLQNSLLRFPPGHYYSPIVNPSNLKESIDTPRGINGVYLDKNRMIDWWITNVALASQISDTNNQSIDPRYTISNDFYPIGDAAVLRAMILSRKPNTIIEIGSGYSTACIMDAIEYGHIDTKIHCIEPYPARLKSLLKDRDLESISLIESSVQDVDKRLFLQLRENDILLIDSTHVLKTQSDVHSELFEIIPSVAKGVIIHIHDVHYPFEYPAEWIYNQNYSWNEIYAIRAFLMYNYEFEIIFMNNFFAKACTEIVRKTWPMFLSNPGAALWLQRRL